MTMRSLQLLFYAHPLSRFEFLFYSLIVHKIAVITFLGDSELNLFKGWGTILKLQSIHKRF